MPHANLAALDVAATVEAARQAGDPGRAGGAGGLVFVGCAAQGLRRLTTRMGGRAARAAGPVERRGVGGGCDDDDQRALHRPAVVAEAWRLFERLGFAGGRVLEPGCGSGAFIAAAPADAEMVGVELDPTTARVARLLYPSAQIRTEGFETTRRPDGSFVAAVGNVPFGKISLHDPTHNRRGHSIHNHFIIKSLRLCRARRHGRGRDVEYTLDAQNPAARREMAELADLVGAVRLPSGAMRRMAGTEVVCDLVVLRRREAGQVPDETGWARSVTVDTPGGAVRMNEYFATHPEMILGEPTAARGMYRDGDLVVKADLALNSRRGWVRRWITWW